MGGSQKVAQQGNAIAQASLNESKRQYNEQKAKEDKKKATAQANAVGSRTSANRAYANNFNQATDFTTGRDGVGYSLLTAGGTPSVISTMLGGGEEATQNTTLG